MKQTNEMLPSKLKYLAENDKTMRFIPSQFPAASNKMEKKNTTVNMANV